MNSSLAKKIFAVGASSALIVAALPFVALAAQHAVGTNVISNGTVYFINSQNQKQPYTSAGAFLSYGFNSWANVAAASPEDLALPTGSFVPPADGSLINDMGTVYVITGGQRAGFTSADVFQGLGYSFSNVLVGDTSFLPTMAPVSSTSIAHPVGALINMSGTVYLVTATGRLGIPSLAVFNSWGYSFNNVVPANSYDSALPMSTAVMMALTPGQLSPTNPTTGIVVPPTTTNGTVSVSAATDMPAAGTIVSGQAAADLAHFNFYGTGTVTSLTFNKIGVSSNTALNNVYLYQGNTRLTDGSYVNSNNQVTFSNPNGLFVLNGSPMDISVRADVAGPTINTGSGTIGLQLTTAMTGTTNVTGTPISGNLFTIASLPAGSLATATVGAVTVPAANATVNAGTTNYTVWSSPLTIGNRSVLLKGASFKVIGSIPNTSFANFGLYLNGSQVATAPTGINANDYITFDLSAAPVTVQTGSNTLEVHADITSGSSRNFQVSLQNAADLMLTDTNYNVNISPTNVSSTSFTPVIGGQVLVNGGTLSVSLDPTYTVTTLTPGATQAIIGSYQFEAYGEDVQVNNLTVAIAGPASLNNVSLFLNGAQVGSTQQYIGTALNYSFGSSFIVPANTTATLQVKADLNTSANAPYSGAVTTTLSATTSNNAQGRSSSTLTTAPSAPVQSTTLTSGGSVPTLSANAGFLSQVVTPNTQKTRIGSFVIQAGNAEGFRVTNEQVNLLFATPTYTSGTVTAGSQAIAVSSTVGFAVGNVITIPGAVATVGTVTAVTDATHLQVNVTTAGTTPTVGGAITGGVNINTISSLYTSDNTTPVNPAATTNFPVNFTIPANNSHTVDIFANLGTQNFGTVTTSMLVTGTGATSNVAVTDPSSGTALTGQVATVGTGTLSATSTLGASAALAQLVASANTPTAGPANDAAFNFVALNGGATLNEMKVTVVNPAHTALANAVTQVTIGSGSTAVTVPVTFDGTNYIAYATGLNIAIPTGNAGMDVPVVPTYNFVGTNGISTGTGVVLDMTYYKYQSGATVSTATTNVYSNPMVVVASVPTIAGTSTIASNSSYTGGAGNDVIEFTITAGPTGPVRFRQIGFTPHWGGTLTNAAADVVQMYNVTNPSTILNSMQANINLGTTTSGGGVQKVITLDQDESIAAGTTKTYRIKADTTGIGSGNYFRVDLTNSNDTYSGTPVVLSTLTTANDWAWNDYSTNLYINGYLLRNLTVTGPTFSH